MEVLCFRLPGHGDATLQNLNTLRSSQHFCDITIVASDQQTFRGHKVVLAACSPFLRDQFLLNPSSELQVSMLYSSSVVCQLLQSCYTGILQFNPKEIVNYLTAASYLQMEHVVEKCRGALSQYLQPRVPSPSGVSLHAFVVHFLLNIFIRNIGFRNSVKPAGPSRQFQEEEEREDYEVFQVCIEEDEEAGREKGCDEDGERIGDLMGGAVEREGYRILRRRQGDRGGGRARGLCHRKRQVCGERRLPGEHFQDDWHVPISEEIMGSYGLVQSDFSHGGTKSREDILESVAVVGSTSSSGGPISCDPCGLTFPSTESLTMHARSAHPLFVCPRCGKQFNHASNLNRHMSIHRGTKSHACHLCHKTFTQKSTLRDHMNLHSGERPHRCSYCHVRFAHKPALRRHLREQHGKTTAQNCMEAQREKDREREREERGM
uniref:Zinc finger and BTB domain containing 12, tandem duplicate 1 n=1 Tax=Scleropages formosus TaxID=113540 RepID=A0A8D0C670_SCLFO